MIRLRILLVAIAAVFLLWTITQAQQTGRGWAMRVDHAIDQFALGDRALQRDLLSARAGILRDYDPLNRDTALASEAVQNLQHLARPDPALSKAVAVLAADLDARDNLVERFKSDNALLQNSLARFASRSAVLDSPQAAQVSASILELTLNTGPDAVQAALASLKAFERQGHPPPWLRTHGEMLVRMLPEVDGMLAASRDAPVERDAAEVRRLIVKHEAAQAAADVRRRIMLTAEVMLAVGLLGVLAFSLYARDRDLRRQAENERLSATVASLLIGAQPHDLVEHVERALQQLAQRLDGDQAYLALGSQTFAWASASESKPTDGWWATAAELAARRDDWNGHMLIAAPAEAEPDEFDAWLGQAGVRSFLAIRTQAGADVEALLGFAARGRPLRVRSEAATGLVAALAAIRATLQRDRLEAERIQLERRLALARRMETVGAVASGVAHNFNNIIGAISGFNEMAELHMPRNSKAVDDLAEIRLAVGRARDLIDQVLSFGRHSSGDTQWFALEGLVDETTRMLKASLPRSVMLEAQLAPLGGEVRGDPGQVQQALMNICNNAAHVQGGRGEVTVSLDRRDLRQPLVLSHGALDPGAYGVIAVADRGPGVPPSARERIFEPFFTTRRGGTGLGLSTAWEIVQVHGGTIDVGGEAGQGAVFSIWLPLARQIARPAAPPPKGCGQPVLLVGLDPARLAEDAETVAVLGYEVIVAPGAAQAMALKAQGPFEAIVVVGGSCAEIERASDTLSGVWPATPIIRAAYPLRTAELSKLLAERVSGLVDAI